VSRGIVIDPRSRRARDRVAVARELTHGLALLGLTGSSVGGVVGVLALASRFVGR
jgi:hypothetical protein